MPATQAFLAFNAGELTPYLRHRTDFEKQPSGAELLQNFVAMPFGGVRKRPGTRWTKQLDGPTRLESFQFDAETAYVLAFTATALTVFHDDGKTVVATITDDFGDPFLLQFVQINSVIFITSKSVSPKRLSRFDDTTWVLEEIPWSYPPLLDQNLNEDFTYNIHRTVASAPWTTGFAYIAGDVVTSAGRVWECFAPHTSDNTPFFTSNEPGVGPQYADFWKEYFIPKGSTGSIGTALTNTPFDPGHVGAYYEISKRRAFDQFEVFMKLQSPTVVPQYSPTILIKGQWSFITTGIWNGTVYIQRSTDNGVTWTDFRSYTSLNDQNFTTDGTEDSRALYRLRYFFADAGMGTVAPRATLTSEEPYITSLIKITGLGPGTNYSATFEAIDDIDTGSTDLWREGAFSDYQGFPAAIAIHERRLVFAGTVRHPVSIWTSRTDDLLKFTPGSTEADASIFITLAASRQDPIRWIASQRRLIVGTAGSEWVFGSDTSDAALSPENLLVRQYTFYGSAALPALTMQTGVFFIERQGRRLRELAYQIDQETYNAADLTRLAEHITETGLVQTAWQGNREPALWAVRADGVMIHFSYIRTEKVYAWSRHITAGGLFRSVAVLRNDADDDVVWAVVERDGVFHLEYFVPSQQATQEAGDLVHCYHVDSGVTGTLDGSNRLATPPHLDGQSLAVLADGYVLALTAAGGFITLPYAYTVVTAGLLVESRLITLPPEIQTDAGATHGKLKRSNSVKLSLYQSYGGQIIYKGQTSDITTTTAETPADVPAPLASGWFEATLGGGYDPDMQFEIHHASPHPYTVRAAAVQWSVSEGV
jgi:hypothetical protein